MNSVGDGLLTCVVWIAPGRLAKAWSSRRFLLQQVGDQVQADAQLLQPVGGPRIVGLFGAQQTPE